jgi:hypothetical protein
VRTLAWLLLLANAGMAVWILTQPEPPAPQYRPLPVPPGVDPLVLLSERPTKPGATRAGADRHVAEQPAAAPAPHEAQSAEVAAPPVAEAGAREEETKNKGEAAPGSAAQSRPPAVCRTVGPFKKENDANAVSAQLAALGYRLRGRKGEVRNPAGYWVYMPAMPVAQAHRIVAELDAKGMTDYYIGKQNYISLGIFSTREKAETRRAQLAKLGFDADLRRRYRTADVYWLDIDRSDVPLATSDAWAAIQGKYPAIRVQRVSCE